MTRYLLDTNHVSAIFKKQAHVFSRISASSQSEFGVSLPTIGELWFMVFNSARIAQNTADLQRVLTDFRPWDFHGGAALEFGRIKSELKRTGRPIPDVDVQIAAVARVNGLILLTADAHFNAVAGLTVENWLIPPTGP
jgi:tRNA(fMet)-specific endonuclease VapC